MFLSDSLSFSFLFLGGQISQEEKDTLDAIRAYLNIDDEAAFDMHLKAGAAFYGQSISEAMAASPDGIISDT